MPPPRRCREFRLIRPQLPVKNSLMTRQLPVVAGQILTGPRFREPVRVETVFANGPESWVVGVVGTQSERFRRITLTASDLARLMILDDDAVFNVVGEVLPAAHVERVLRDYYAGKLGDADLEERMPRDVSEAQFRAICQHALQGLASKKLNLEVFIERRARAQERRVAPEIFARFLREAVEFVPLTRKTVPSLPHAFEPARSPAVLRRYEKDSDWKLPALAAR